MLLLPLLLASLPPPPPDGGEIAPASIASIVVGVILFGGLVFIICYCLNRGSGNKSDRAASRVQRAAEYLPSFDFLGAPAAAAIPSAVTTTFTFTENGVQRK